MMYKQYDLQASLRIIEKSKSLDLDEFLSQPLYAFLASESQDGPCCSPVWFLWEDGKIWIISVKGDSFSKRVVQQPKSAISIIDWDRTSGKIYPCGF